MGREVLRALALLLTGSSAERSCTHRFFYLHYNVLGIWILSCLLPLDGLRPPVLWAQSWELPGVFVWHCPADDEGLWFWLVDGPLHGPKRVLFYSSPPPPFPSPPHMRGGRGCYREEPGFVLNTYRTLIVRAGTG